MNCLEARKCMYDYLNRDLDERTLRDFLSHLEDCPECMEELKITHMVYTGVEKLENEDDDLNLDRAFRKSLEQSRFHLIRLSMLTTGRYAADTAVFWSLVLALLLRGRILLQKHGVELRYPVLSCLFFFV